MHSPIKERYLNASHVKIVLILLNQVINLLSNKSFYVLEGMQKYGALIVYLMTMLYRFK